MIREAFEYIVNLGQKEVVNVNGQSFSTGKLNLIEDPTPATILVHSLTGLVDYLKSEFDGKEPVMIHVKSPTVVDVFSGLNDNENRSKWITAEAMLPHFRFDSFQDTEEFNIKLQSCFVTNEDRDIMLKVVGNIKEDDVKTYGDDGVSQSVTAKTGVAQVGDVAVPNPVTLAPYRTFIEVDQPESNFVFRMRKGPACALFEADGGAWKNAAMNLISEYLADELVDLIEANRVHIIA